MDATTSARRRFTGAMVGARLLAWVIASLALRVGVLGVVAVCVLGGAAPAVADDAFSLPGAGGGSVDGARDGVLLWTLVETRDEPQVCGGHSPCPRPVRTSLHTGFGGGARAVPVAPGPFDWGFLQGADLGTDSHGRLVAVYDRCTGITPHATTVCTIYRYSFADRRERRLREGGCDDLQPLIDGGVLVFHRVGASSSFDTGIRTTRRCRPGIYVQRPGRRARRLTPRGFCVPESFVRGVLACVRLAIVSQQPDGTDTRTTEVRTLRIGERHWKLVARAAYVDQRDGNTGVLLDLPVLAGPYVYWRRYDYGSRRYDIQRRRLTGGPVTTMSHAGRLWTTPDGFEWVGPFAVDGNALYYTAIANEHSLGNIIGRADLRHTAFR